MKAEIANLQGTWEIVALEVDGKTLVESGFQGSRIVVKGSTFTTISMGRRCRRALLVSDRPVSGL